MVGSDGTSRDWRSLRGMRQLVADLPRWAKIAITLLVMCGLVTVVIALTIPNPNMVLIAGLVMASAIFGVPGGVVAAAVMMAYTLYFFSVDHSFVTFTDENLAKVLVTAFGVTVVGVFVCALKEAQDAALADAQALMHLLEFDRDQLETESMTDALTGLRNRAALRRDWGRVVEARELCAVLMLDVDDFKGVNDTLGHAAGDACLCEIGSVLVAVFGPEVCYRYGGDEFLVIVPGWDLSRLEAATDTLRHGISRITVGERHVHFSGGYVVGRIAHDDFLTHMVSLADENLYRAKRAGKDRIVGGTLGWGVQA